VQERRNVATRAQRRCTLAEGFGAEIAVKSIDFRRRVDRRPMGGKDARMPNGIRPSSATLTSVALSDPAMRTNSISYHPGCGASLIWVKGGQTPSA
jgi:hypothetical protein